ncbi:MAG: family 43 glycosylhydrolase [Bacteroidaceae bacterium]|nr:family 43 glycosylhydrolase [Bacteroidaceae bacterium]
MHFLLFTCSLLAQYSIPADSIRIRDPFVTVDHDKGLYYIVTAARSNGKFALKAYESKDLKMWKDNGIVYEGNQNFIAKAEGKKDSWWAPDTYFYKGHYYTIVTMSCESEGLLRCCTLLDGGKNPMGPYKDVFTQKENIGLTPVGQQCLDGSLYVDEKGQPWLIYSLEWNGPDVTDMVGETWAVRLKKRNLKGRKGDPIRLFRANEATWLTHSKNGMVVDAPFIWKDEQSGKLILLWSSFVNGVYAVGQATSASGKVEGPWIHEKQTIYTNGGHEMLFRDLNGNLKMSLHHNNNDGHLKIVDVEIVDGKVRLK